MLFEIPYSDASGVSDFTRSFQIRCISVVLVCMCIMYVYYVLCIMYMYVCVLCVLVLLVIIDVQRIHIPKCYESDYIHVLTEYHP